MEKTEALIREDALITKLFLCYIYVHDEKENQIEIQTEIESEEN